MTTGPLTARPLYRRPRDRTGGFHRAPIGQACLLTVFLAITFLLPDKGRPDGEPHGSATEPATGSDAKQHHAV